MLEADELPFIETTDYIADALIEAGLKFDTVVSHTAAFDLMQLEQINRLEIRVAEAEHRAEVAERALFDFCKKMLAIPSYMLAVNEVERLLRQAEKELAEEGK